MAECWYAIIAVMLVIVAVLEGWDFGIGALHLLVARTDAERRQVIRAIGPLWIWHETWLVAAGGTLLMAFPAVMATACSGFYLALYVVLWCLLLRGIALEFGGHASDRMWRAWWDAVFAAASLLLALLSGIALGNLIRGLPLDGGERLAMALFTDFTPYGRVGMLDWYSMSVGLLAVVLLMAHGAAYLALRTTHRVHERSRAAGGWLWPLAGLLLLLVTAETWAVRPELFSSAAQRPPVWLAAAVAVGGAQCLVRGGRRRRDGLSLLGSTLVIAGLLGGAALVLYPEMLHSTLQAASSLSAERRAADAPGLGLALIWWPAAAFAAVAAALIVLRTDQERIGPADQAPDPAPEPPSGS